MYLPTNNPAEIAAHCAAQRGQADTVFLVLLTGCSVDDLPDLVAQLDGADLRFAGGLFPALIDGTQIRRNGTVVVPLDACGDVAVADISGSSVDWQTGRPAIRDQERPNSLFVLGDFSCVAITDCLEDLFDEFADSVSYFGGGCGAGVREPAPVLFSHHGVHTGAAVVLPSMARTVVGLRHGWSRFSDPIVATRSERNLIHTINWQPASTVYEEIVGVDVVDSLRRRDDVPRAKRYPFGIARSNAEDVVRDPLMEVDDGGLLVLSGVPEHSMLRVLKGEDDKLIAAAETLGQELADTNGSTCLLFDCYSRAMLLGDNIDRELEGFHAPLQANGRPCAVFGAMALGEIASGGERYPDFHNKTVAGCVLTDG